MEAGPQARIFLALSIFTGGSQESPLLFSAEKCESYIIYIMELGNIGGLIAFVLGWFLAQSGKMIGDIIKKKRLLGFKEFVNAFTRSGGMPSGHTASFIGLTTFLGLKNGFTSGLFVLAAATAAIVIYDAVNVRYAVGEQGKLLNIMAELDNSKKTKKMKVIEGHTVPQVCVGAVLGIILGILCNAVF